MGVRKKFWRKLNGTGAFCEDMKTTNNDRQKDWILLPKYDRYLLISNLFSFFVFGMISLGKWEVRLSIWNNWCIKNRWDYYWNCSKMSWWILNRRFLNKFRYLPCAISTMYHFCFSQTITSILRLTSVLSKFYYGEISEVTCYIWQGIQNKLNIVFFVNFSFDCLMKLVDFDSWILELQVKK